MGFVWMAMSGQIEIGRNAKGCRRNPRRVQTGDMGYRWPGTWVTPLEDALDDPEPA
jgi:hypothetical protein